MSFPIDFLKELFKTQNESGVYMPQISISSGVLQYIYQYYQFKKKSLYAQTGFLCICENFVKKRNALWLESDYFKCHNLKILSLYFLGGKGTTIPFQIGS